MDVAHILNHVKSRLASLTPLQKACIFLFIVSQVLVLAVVTYYGGDQILHSLARLAAWISHSKLGILVLYIFMTVCALPPVHGFTTCITIFGMAFASTGAHATISEQVYTLLYAWILATVGLVLSACISMMVLRRMLHHLHGQWHMLARIKEDRRFRALQRAIAEHGLVMATLARFCPLPFCYTNLLLASLDSLSFGTFALSTFITAPRLIFPLIMGAKMYELSDRNIRESLDPMSKRMNAAFIFISMLFAVGSSWFIWHRTRRALHLDQLPADEEEPSFLLDDVLE
jgi:uncharacterized membrane protein YdjX (TVP38/TMEM64 family)